MSTEVANESGYEVDGEEFAALARYVLEEMRVHPQAELSILFVTTEVMSELHER
jgi:probable rRNA maturation factor